MGTNIRDERPANSTLDDAEITYDFIGSDPDTDANPPVSPAIESFSLSYRFQHP